MKKQKTVKFAKIFGAAAILIGALSVFTSNGLWIHDVLQVIFVTGCILYLYGARLEKPKL